MDNKRRLCRLIESFINDFQIEAVESIYGKGSTIKIHTIDFGVTTNVIQIEAIVMLGDVINEDVLVGTLAEVLIRESMVYFFPDSAIKTYVRFDV
jgi:hypothetical protein